MSQDAGALTTIYWWTCCHRYTETEHSQQVPTLTHKCRLLHAHTDTTNHGYLPTTHKHALATLQSGSTVPTNNPTRHHNQHIFTTAPCPHFYAEKHGCQRRGNSAHLESRQHKNNDSRPPHSKLTPDHVTSPQLPMSFIMVLVEYWDYILKTLYLNLFLWHFVKLVVDFWYW